MRYAANRLAASACLILMFCVVLLPAREPAKTIEGRNGMVVAVSPPAAETGLAVLKKGGNAVDAAVATALAMAVTWPSAGNIGGGGFLLLYPPRGEPTLIEYRERAPLAATKTMFSKEDRRLSHKVA